MFPFTALAATVLSINAPAQDILQHLDILTFRSSLRPSALEGRRHAADWGFDRPSRDGKWALLSRLGPRGPDWTIGLRIIRRDGNALIACFSDTAQNGGSYRAQSALRIVATSTGYRVIDNDVNEPSCRPFPGQG